MKNKLLLETEANKSFANTMPKISIHPCSRSLLIVPIWLATAGDKSIFWISSSPFAVGKQRGALKKLHNYHKPSRANISNKTSLNIVTRSLVADKRSGYKITPLPFFNRKKVKKLPPLPPPLFYA